MNLLVADGSLATRRRSGDGRRGSSARQNPDGARTPRANHRIRRAPTRRSDSMDRMRSRQVSRRTTKIRKRTAEGTWTGASFMIAEPSEIRAGAWEAQPLLMHRSGRTGRHSFVATKPHEARAGHGVGAHFEAFLGHGEGAIAGCSVVIFESPSRAVVTARQRRRDETRGPSSSRLSRRDGGRTLCAEMRPVPPTPLRVGPEPPGRLR